MIRFYPKWLANIPIARKLYFVVITMVILITLELLSLWFSINTLSAVRTYVNGEGLWAKAQKDAAYHLVKYGNTHDKKDYETFLNFLKINLGDKRARLELDKSNPDYSIIIQGFAEGRNHPMDIKQMIKLYRRFHNVSYMAKAISIWSEADLEISKLEAIGRKLNNIVTLGNVSQNEINKILIEIDILNNKLTKLEDDFSFTLGEASRWMANLLIKVLFMVALTIEISVLLLTLLFTRRISKGIEEINFAAKRVANGDFDAKIKIYSNDEIGCLAVTFNQMTDSLEQNILQRKKIESSLKESEELFKNAFNNAPIGVSLVSMEGKFLRVNKSLCRILGYSEEELLEKTFSEITYSEDKETSNNLFQKSVTGELPPINFEKRYLNKQGKIILAKLNTSLIKSIDGKPLYFITHTEDITEQRLSELRIHEQAALLDKAQDAIIVRDLDYNVIYWNKSAERLYGWTESEVLSNRNMTQHLYVEKTSELIEAQENILEKGEWIGELRQLTKNGNEIIVQSRWNLICNKSGTPKSILTVNTDITEKKKIESQFYRSQRLESIGTLTGGIAHDLNNILTPIMMSVQLLRMELSETKKATILTTLEKSAQRGSDIIKQLLFFARGVEGNKEPIQIRELIIELEKMIIETFPKSIIIETDISEALWHVYADSTQLQQVFLNLCVNARDAMPDGGTLKIFGENMFLDENFIQMYHEAKKGPFVCINISDTGKGIAPEIMDKIFEPFFTTKELSKGSGLGLSIIIGIVKSHGGFISVYSEVNRGSLFKIFLPAIKSYKAERAKNQDLHIPKGNGELILVVDDESSILEIAQSTLETYGYKVITANNGLEAVEIFKRIQKNIKVIITDINMPYMDGFSLIKSLNEINPATKFIASSGLLISKNNIELAAFNVKAFLQKPYTAENLLRKINEVLG